MKIFIFIESDIFNSNDLQCTYLDTKGFTEINICLIVLYTYDRFKIWLF